MFTQSHVNRFAIRKYAIGVCSVMVASLFFLGGRAASADQLTSAPNQPVVSQLPVVQAEVASLQEQELAKPTTVEEVQLELDTPQEEPVSESTIPIVADHIADEQTVSAPTEELTTAAKNVASSDVLTVADQAASATSAENLELPQPTPTAAFARTAFRTAGHTRAAGVLGDTYPAKWKHLDPDSNIDDWGMYVRYCTSFVAHRLSTVNKFEIPRAYGNAEAWGNRASTEGYRVDDTPAQGAVAWSAAAPDNWGYGHVAWVAAVNGDMVTVEEYNYGKRHAYNSRTVHKSNFTGYIHFKDLPNRAPATPVTRGTITVQNINDQTGDFDVVVTDVFHSNGVSAVKLPIWSKNGGQDDIVWYDAQRLDQSTYKVSVNISNHRQDTGDYHIHMYYQKPDGQLVWGGAKDIHVKVGQTVSTTGQIKIMPQTATGDFNVLITDVAHAKGVKEVKVPIWSDKGGQDDIIWYTAQAQGNNTYKVSVKTSQHKSDTGTYHIHLYYLQNDGQLYGAGATTTVVEKVTPAPSLPASGTYHFTKTLPIKTQPSLSAATLDHYYAGESVHYDRVLTAEGRQWLSYLSHSGARRYIPLN